MTNGEYGEFSFRLLDDGTYEAQIVKFAKTVMVPDSYEGVAVTAVSSAKGAVGANQVEDILIPEGVERIGCRAFFNCFTVNAITLPSSLKVVEQDAFSIIGSVKEVYVCDLPSYLSVDFGNSNANPLRSGAVLFVENERFSSPRLTVPDGVQRIGAYALSGMKGLISLTIPACVEHIGEGAFEGCHKLCEIINLSEVSLSGREDVAEVLNITDSEDTSRLTQLDDGFVFYSSDGEDYLVGYTGSERNLVLPDDFFGRAYSVYKYAFTRCDSLMSVTFGRRVKKIGEYAFNGCYFLGEIIFPEDSELFEIGDSAFLCCEWLGDTTLPKGLAKIERCAFGYCSLLNGIYIPKGVGHIAVDSFEGCRNLNVFLEAQSVPEGFPRGWDVDVYSVNLGAKRGD
ncbi:MAG: leucine-rich repeat domain-containing protein [Clostridia bacterium]|nr:leucine-rich repeat domain-containing protein [Clostridia bacterium]